MSKPKRPRAAARPAEPEEWVIGRVRLPLYVEDAQPFRPDMILCLSTSTGPLGAQAVPPETSDDEVAREVLVMSRQPTAGPPRRPARIRVAAPALRDALIRAFGPGVTVTLDATPEIDEMVARFASDMRKRPKDEAAGGPTYLTGGRIEPALAGRFFAAAAELHRAAPWTIVPSDTDLLEIDVPSIGAAALAISVIGQMREQFGVVVFASRAELDRFVSDIDSGAAPSGAPSVRSLTITYNPLDALPGPMRGEIAAHGFPIADPSAVPALIRTDAEGVARPLVADDYLLGTIVAGALARFFGRHPIWPGAGVEPIVERLVLDDLPERPEVIVKAVPSAAAPGRPTRPQPAAPKPVTRDLRGVRPTTEVAVRRVCGELWGKEFLRRFRDEMTEAMQELQTVAGPEMGPEELGDTMGSLPLMWPALWRPMRDGRTGIEAARSWSKLSAPVLAAALDRLAAARGVYAEVAAVAPDGRLVLRDLFDGTPYRIAVPEAVHRELTRWTRVLTVLADLGDGTWTFPSVMQRVPPDLAATLTPDDVVHTAREALRAIGADPEDIDPRAPHAGLARWAALVSAALLRSPAATPAEAPKRRYLVNGDGERFELHEADLRLSRAARTRLATALGRTEGVEQTDRTTFTWIGPASAAAPHGESVGSLDFASGGRLTTNSAERHACLFEVIGALAEEKVEIKALKRTQPWAQREGFADEEGPDTERMVVALGLVQAEMSPGVIKDYVLASMRRTLDETVPALGGAPRALVATEAGRAAVEAWLREAELKGTAAQGGGDAFLDLDPLREELGLPTVAAGLGKSG
jgi:hypothetical protein